MEQHQVKIGNFEIGNKLPLALIAGPCQIQSRQHAVELAGKLVELTSKLGINYIFKASFDKANRTSITGARGVGIEEGIRTFDEIKKLYGCPIVTDIHERAVRPTWSWPQPKPAKSLTLKKGSSWLRGI